MAENTMLPFEWRVQVDIEKQGTRDFLEGWAGENPKDFAPLGGFER